VIIGRCAERLRAGAAKVLSAVVVAVEARVVRNRRRVIALPARKRPDIR
jgi:hypothetical protein